MSEPKEITREEMLRFFDAMIELTCMVDKEMVMSIRKHLEKPEPRVSREDVEKAVQSCEQEFPIISKGWDIFGPVVIAILTKLGFRVEGLGTQD